MRHRLLALFLAAPLVVLAGPAAAVTIDWVAVGDAGNAADPDPNTDNCGSASNLPCGSVPYDYYISKYEVTNDQYTEFLNAVAKADPNNLYFGLNGYGTIARSGVSGSYSYAVVSGYQNRPVTYINYYSALRFANWLQNGQPVGPQGPGTTEGGAYTFSGPTTVGARNAGALTFLTSENEWYKAAYFNGTSFFDYPSGTNAGTVCSVPTATANRANCNTAGTTPVGSYTNSASPYGTFDQGGNAWEWTEGTAGGFQVVRGGGFIDLTNYGTPASLRGVGNAGTAYGHVGFRVASLVPEPGTGLLLTTGLLGLAARRQRRA